MGLMERSAVASYLPISIYAQYILTRLHSALDTPMLLVACLITFPEYIFYLWASAGFDHILYTLTDRISNYT